MNDVCAVQYIDHVGIAVKDLEATMSFFHDMFQIPPGEAVELPEQGVRATLLAVGQTRLELLEPLSPDSPVGRFLERQGEGLHHLAFRVDDISEKLTALSSAGVRLVDREPRSGLSGNIAFIHPRSVYGILTELVQAP